MELTTQYTNTSSTQNTPPETSADRSLSANAPAAQARIFPEYGFSDRSALTPQDRAVDLRPNTAAHLQSEGGKHLASDDQLLSREKRGGVLGACARSPYRECRGGEALEESSSSYERFDQTDRRETRGPEGRGSCDGIVRETMSRINKNFGTQSANVLSQIKDMKSEMKSGAAADNRLYDRIQGFQNNLIPLPLSRFDETLDRSFLPPRGTTPPPDEDRERRIGGLMTNLEGLSVGGLAYIHVGIERGNAASNLGHVLLAQRLPPDPSGDGYASPDRYQILDPNNGVFTYESRGDMESALRRYIDTAFAEDGYRAVPDRLQLYSPHTADDGPPHPTTTVVPPLDAIQLEPPELPHHRFAGNAEL
ncbi:hypothetical protein [Paraburkholderia fungorum]|uniref:hypothetical protein n=1 Tax=Paraburkholderia fungorum TaxID=134537 RepID=UPI0038BA6BA9